ARGRAVPGIGIRRHIARLVAGSRLGAGAAPVMAAAAEAKSPERSPPSVERLPARGYPRGCGGTVSIGGCAGALRSGRGVGAEEEETRQENGKRVPQKTDIP